MYDLSVGVIVSIRDLVEGGANLIKDLGIDTCQVNCWNMDMYTEENAKKLMDIMDEGIKITDLWAGWTPPTYWNFIEGPITLGLVPASYRAERINCLKKGADFAKMIGVSGITTHVGFIPENPSSQEYYDTVIAVREVAAYCRRLGLNFNFETGQETPITLIRIMEDVGLDNLGINLDPANLLMYGKANPVDAVDIYKDRVKNVHVKDGVYPVDGRELGEEKPIGDGLVNFPELIKKLHKYGFNGALIIEREISGPQQKVDILKARNLLNEIMKQN